MKNTVFEFCLCVIENIIVFYFLNSLFKKRFAGILPTVLAVLINSGIVFACSGFDPVIKAFIPICALIAGCFILYKDKPVIKTAYSFLALYFLYIVEIISANIFSLLTNRNIEQTFNIFVYRMTFTLYTKIVDILIFALIYKMVSKIEPILKNKYWFLLNGIIFVFFAAAAVFLQIYPSLEPNNTEKIMYMVILSLFFVISLIVTYFFSEVSKDFQRDSKLFLLENNYSNLREQIEYQRQNEERFRKLRHDMLNHLSNVRTLIDCGETESAIRLLDKTTEKVELTLSDKAVNTGNKIVDAILLSKIAVCHSKSISFDYSVEPLGEPDIDVTDLSSLISNLLDNAIEAAVQTDKPFVKISVFRYNAYYTVCTENSYKGKASIRHNAGALTSTKSDIALHGYGTQIINDIALKYDGNFSWETEENSFIATVLLKI